MLLLVVALFPGGGVRRGIERGSFELLKLGLRHGAQLSSTKQGLQGWERDYVLVLGAAQRLLSGLHRKPLRCTKNILEYNALHSTKLGCS